MKILRLTIHSFRENKRNASVSRTLQWIIGLFNLVSALILRIYWPWFARLRFFSARFVFVGFFSIRSVPNWSVSNRFVSIRLLRHFCWALLRRNRCTFIAHWQRSCFFGLINWSFLSFAWLRSCWETCTSVLFNHWVWLG